MSGKATVYLRDYQSGDFEAVYALDCVCFAPRFRFSRAMMQRVVGARGAVVVLAGKAAADGAEAVAGFCAAEQGRNAAGEAVGYLATLDVDPAWRGRGVGRALVEEVERRLALAGASAMWLHVYTGNRAAVRLYERLGYQRAGEEPGFYGAGFDAWVYAKELA